MAFGNSVTYSFTQPGGPIILISATTQKVSLVSSYSGTPVAPLTVYAYGTPIARSTSCTCTVPVLVTVTVTQILTQQTETLVPYPPASTNRVETITAEPTHSASGAEGTVATSSSSCYDTYSYPGFVGVELDDNGTPLRGYQHPACKTSFSVPRSIVVAFATSSTPLFATESVGAESTSCTTSLVTKASVHSYTTSSSLYNQSAILPTSLIVQGMTSIRSSTYLIAAPTLPANSTASRVITSNTVITTPYYGHPWEPSATPQLFTGGAEVNSMQGQSFKLAFFVWLLALFMLA